MSGNTFTPAQAAFSRVFLIEGRARPDHSPQYESCLKADALDQAFGDVERIECPDPDAYGRFIEIGSMQGAIERMTTSLVGKYAADLQSDLLRLAKARCPADVQIHFGACTDPRAFNNFSKALILEGVHLTNWGTEALGALSSDDNAAVNETADISIGEAYEALPLNIVERGKDIVTNPLVDVVICDNAGCGECDNESDGCQRIYAIAGSTGGSPGTAPDLVYSLDKGANWAADDVDSLAPSDSADAVACLDIYVVVVSHGADSISWKHKHDVDAGVIGGWTEVTTGIVAAGSPTDAWSVGTYMFICGDTGYIYGTDDPTVGVTVLDAGVATVQNLAAIHAISDTFAVAVGAAGAVVWTKDRVTWALATAPVAAALTCVWVKNEDEWFVGTATGALYYTLDRGVTWTALTIPGGPYTTIWDIAFATKSVGYLSGGVAGPAAKMLRTFDGGHSWVVLPEGVGAIPTVHQLDAIAACEYDPNFVVAVGLNEGGVDGVILVGAD